MDEYMTIKNGEPYKIKFTGEESLVELNNFIPFDLTFDIRFVDIAAIMESKFKDYNFEEEDDDEDFDDEDEMDFFYDAEELYYMISDETSETVLEKINNFYPFVTATLFNNSTDRLAEVFDNNLMAVLNYVNAEMYFLFKFYSINLIRNIIRNY